MTAPRVTGSVAYPAGVEPAALDRLADVLASASRTFDSVDDQLVGAAATASQHWQGDAAVTFGDHLRDRAHTFDLAARQATRAVALLREYAAALRDDEAWYERWAERERLLRAQRPPRQEAIATAAADQQRCVDDVERLGRRFGPSLSTIGRQLDDYATRGFLGVGDHLEVVPGTDGRQGRFIVADALDATEDGRIERDEIQVRRLDDGSYVVVLPGVTDLDDGGFLGNNLDDTVRKTPNAFPTTMRAGQLNPYAEMVKMAMGRAGIPPGADVTFVGHSYGAYTSVDLAGDDAFNSADGTSNGYHVNVRRVVSVAADTDWKPPRVPRQTDVVVLNSREDKVYQIEAQTNPEVDWLWRGDRLAHPLLLPTVPQVGPVVSRPTGRTNQVEVEVNAGARLNADDKLSGHHPMNYSPQIRDAPARRPMRPVLDGTGTARVVETYDVRVPDRVLQVIPGR